MKLFSTSCETLFLGWDAPLLPKAVRLLRDRFATEDRLHLASLDCVLPSAHGVHRLAELLTRQAGEEGLELELPRIMTLGQLPERLYRPPRPVALEFEQTLAWARVLRGMEPEHLQPLIPIVPPADPIGPWLELAGTLRGLHEELASSRRSFAEVAQLAENNVERSRWSLLRRIQTDYLRELEDVGLCDPFMARRAAIEQDRCRSDRMIVLIGTSDLSDAVVEMLRALESPMIALVAAPANKSDYFDEFGCVNTSAWLNYHLPIEDHQLIPAGDMLDQCAAVAEVIAEYGRDYSADQITVGVTDPSQVGPIEVELRSCGVATHRHLGWTVSQTALGRLFDLTAVHLQRSSWQSLAALGRHADVHAWVSTQLTDRNGDWLTQLDQLLSQHFPVRLDDPLPPEAVKRCPLAQEVGELITRWLACFRGEAKPISVWSPAVERWLATLYGSEWQEGGKADGAPEDGPPGAPAPGAPAPGAPAPDALSPDAPAPDDRVGGRTRLALEASGRVLRRFSDLHPGLDLSVEGPVALEMLSARLAQVRVLEQAEPNDVEILGWLDLALDDAPALVVNGLNHPFVPRSVTADPFLPGALRSKLPIEDNDRRYARDLYAMQLMVSTRPATRFIVGRSGADQSPTPPSRLLTAADARDIARRVRLLLGSRREAAPIEHPWDQPAVDPGPGRHPLAIPPLEAKPGEVTGLSVTAFRDYLTCPYRFYLRHVLKLKPLDDSVNELAANQYGDLIHGALELFGKSRYRDEADPRRIERHLVDYLHQYASQHYSQSSSTAVQIQLAQAERQLGAVALAQARRIADGWRIEQVEASVGPEQNARIVVDGEPFNIRGRFDRIDVCPRGDKKIWSILDYKTHGHPPEKKHLKKTDQGLQWVDLQLPLYRMMVPFLGIDADPADVSLGYFNISGKEGETKINEASFSDALLEQAEELIHDCIRRIRAVDFAPTQERVSFDDYGMILQTGVAGNLLEQVEAWSEEVEA